MQIKIAAGDRDSGGALSDRMVREGLEKLMFETGPGFQGFALWRCGAEGAALTESLRQKRTQWVWETQRTNVAPVAQKWEMAQRQGHGQIMPGFVDCGDEVGIYCKMVGLQVSSGMIWFWKSYFGTHAWVWSQDEVRWSASRLRVTSFHVWCWDKGCPHTTGLDSVVSSGFLSNAENT